MICQHCGCNFDHYQHPINQVELCQCPRCGVNLTPPVILEPQQQVETAGAVKRIKYQRLND